MISIITPVYNNYTFIEACILNVIEQNCPDTEHIIVDGFSSDGTVDIIKRYAKQYPHIQWISERDNGQSDAMNKGINLAKGEIISFLNVDDFYEPDTLNKVVSFFKTLPVPAFLVGNCKVWNEEGKVLFINKPLNLSVFSILQGEPFPNNPSAYFYHKSLHTIVGLYNTNEHYAMDLEFLIRGLPKAYVKYIDENFGNWRKLPGTKTVQDENIGIGAQRRKELFDKTIKNMNVLQKLSFFYYNYTVSISQTLSKYKLYRTISYYFNVYFPFYKR